MTLRNLTQRIVHRIAGATVEHHFTDCILNMPNPLYRAVLPDYGLCRDGVTVYRRFVTPMETAAIRRSIADEYLTYQASGHFHYSLQPLSLHPLVADLALSASRHASAYFQRDAFLSEADYRKILPLNLAQHERDDPKFAKGYSPSHWHYDIRGRQIKAMLYLTDVGPGDQNFACIPGSHKGWKSADYAKSRYTDGQVAAMGLPVREVYGRAGDIVIFNTNIIHRLRRTESRERESITFNFHPGRMLRVVAQTLHPDTEDRTREQLNLMAAVTE